MEMTHINARPNANHPISLHAVQVLQSLCDKLGVTVDLLAHLNVDHKIKDMTVIARSEELHAFQLALNKCKRLDLGLLLGQEMHSASYGILGYVMLVSDQLKTALTCAWSCPLQLGSYFQARLTQQQGLASISFGDYAADVGLYAFNIDTCLSSYWCIIQSILGEQVWPTKIHLKRRQLTYLSAYEALFQCPIILGANEDALFFPTSWLTQPARYHNQTSFEMAYKQCQVIEDSLAQTVIDTWAAKVSTLLAEDIVRYAAIGNVADALCVTERTLRRYLKAEATAFQWLLSEARMSQAMLLLQQGQLRMNQITEQLGYSDPSAFRVAFKRWKGMTPSAFKRQT